MAKNIGSEEGWITIPDTQSSDNDGWITVPDKPKSWGDRASEMAISTVPSVVGSLLGPVGGFIGGGIGEIGRQIYADDEPFNWPLIWTEAGLNTIPVFGKAGKGLWEATKFGTKQGLLQGAAGSVPRHIAETHEWELPSLGEAAVQTGFGGVFGGAAGAGFHAVTRPKRYDISIERSIKPLPEGLMQGDLLAGVPPDTMGTQQQLPFEPRFRGPGDREVRWLDEPYLPYNEGPQQQGLPFSPASDESGQGLLFPDLPTGPKSTTPSPVLPTHGGAEVQNARVNPQTGQTIIPGVTGAIAGSVDNLPPTISAKGFTQADIAYWTAKGYRPGGQGPDGFAQLVRTPTTQSTQPPIPIQPARPRADAGPIEQGQIPIDEGQDIILDNVNEQVVADLKAEGVELIQPLPGGRGLFRRLLSEDRGSFNIDDSIFGRTVQRAIQRLREKLGREPNPTEIEIETAQVKAEMGPQAGESTGGVASFEPKIPTREQAIGMDRTQSDAQLERVVKAIQYWQDRFTKYTDVGDVENARMAYDKKAEAEQILSTLEGRDRYGEIPGPVPPDLMDRMQKFSDSIDQNTNVVDLSQHVVMDPTAASIGGLGPFDAAKKYKELRIKINNGSITPEEIELAKKINKLFQDNPQHAESFLSDITSDGITIEELLRYEADGFNESPKDVIDIGQWPPKTGSFRQGTIQPESITGEPGLPGIGPARLTQDMPIPDEGGIDVAALRLKNIYPNEPRQMSMLDDMADEEIVKYLENEDATPPEISQRNLLNRLINDESGMINSEDIANWIRSRFRRSRGVEPTDQDVHRELERMNVNLSPGTYDLEGQIRLKNLTEAVELNDPIQEMLPVRIPKFNRPPGTDPYYTPNPSHQEIMSERAARIAKLADDARKLEKEGDIDESRNLRRQATEARTHTDWRTHRTTTRGEELLELSKIRAAEGKVEEAAQIKFRAEQMLMEEAGQLKLQFEENLKKKALETGLTAEQTRELMNNVNMVDASTGISHGYAQSTLRGTPDGPPGLELVTGYQYGDHASYKLYYRDSRGKTIGHAQFTVENGVGQTSVLVADKNSGLYGRAVKAMGKELIRMNAARPSGLYSKHTHDLIKRMIEFVNDEKGFIKPDTLGIEALGEGFEKVKGYFARLFREERGSINIGGNKSPVAGRVKKEPTTLEKAIGLPTALTTTGDLSAALRQGLPMIFTKEWWKALGPMLKSAGSQKYADEIDRVIKSKQIFQRSVDTRTNKVIPSFAEKIGMRLIEGSQVTKSEADLAGDWAETGGFLGPAAPVYAQTVGRYAKASNRAYATFLNHLRANTLERLLNDSRRMAMQGASTGRAQTGMFGKFGPSYAVSPDDAINLNAYNNEPLAKEIAAFVNTATGRGPLKFAAPGGEINLESSAKALRFMLFSPRLVASRIRMLNPFTYSMASPTVRKQYMKAALSTAVAWSTISGLAKMAGAEVSEDTNSSDFGKIKIGNTRLDPGGGFQQFLVAASRLITGKYTSSATEQEHELGRGFQATTRKDIAERFMSNKLNPVAKFAWDLMNASEYQPVHVVDRTAQMFVPLVIQDLKEIIDEDPDLLPLMAPIAFGMGTQTYGSGAQAYRLEQAEGKLVPAEYDYMYEGGAAIAPPPEDSLWGSPNVWQ